jgi:hypothetical protein
MTRDVAFAFDGRDGRHIEVGLDVKGVCVGSSSPSLRRSTDNMSRLARDQLDSNDVLSLFKVLLSGIDPAERADFATKLQDLLDAGEPNGGEPAAGPPAFEGRPRPGGSMDRMARDARLPRGMPSFSERFPNASKVAGSASARSRSW